MPAVPGDQGEPRPQEVFISYSRKDKDFVRRLDDALQSRDRKAWVDWQDIRPAEEFMQAIYVAIEGADTFVFVLTPDSVASVPCRHEIAHAAANNKRMVPIVAREVNTDTVPEALAKLNWIFYCRHDGFEQATDKLISALDTDLIGSGRIPAYSLAQSSGKPKVRMKALPYAVMICEPPSSG